MTENTILNIILWLVVVLFSAGSLYFSLKSKGAVQHMDEYWKTIDGLSTVARQAVSAAQQLWDSGQVPKDGGKKVLFDMAFDWVQEHYPSLSDEIITMAIENAVYWLKVGIKARLESPGAGDRE